MRFDVSGDDRSAFSRVFDVCVIGSGPAGVTLARSLAAKGFGVALMEAGGLEWSPESQDVYAGENTGHSYHRLDEARLRFFGGTSYHWNGLCRPFDAEDLAPRASNPLSGWPITRADLDPYAEATRDILELAPEPTRPLDPPPPAEATFQEIQYLRSPPVRFGEKYLDEITAAPRIFLGLNANLVDLRLDPSLTRVTEALFKSYVPGDPGFVVRARAYCLCTGGVENARLLLNFRSQIPEGIGNRTDMVGRFFSEHPGLELGEVLLAANLPEHHFFRPSEAFLAERGLLPAMMRLQQTPRRPRGLGTEIAREAQCALPFGDRLVEAVTGRAPARCDTGGVMEWWRGRDPARHPRAFVSTNSEQALNPDSRVGLAQTRDAFGLDRVSLHWAPQEIDFLSIQAATLAFAGQLAETGLGRMRIRDRILNGPPVVPDVEEGMGNVGSWHHMCTTRMSDDPRTGVVDRDCRVHGTANLYLGGSSVFATGSFANPTYTIVQLALRLGDHLAGPAQTMLRDAGAPAGP